MKKLLLLVVTTLVSFALQGVVSDEVLLLFDRNHYVGWTYHRPDVVLDYELISHNRVALYTAVNGDVYRLESPSLSCVGLDSLRVELDYVLEAVPEVVDLSKVSARVEVLNGEGVAVRSVDISVANSPSQQLVAMVPVRGLTDVSLLLSAPHARESEGYFPAVKRVAVWGVTAGEVPQPVVGEVTGDGRVDVSDVNVVINVMLGKEQDAQLRALAEVTGDGRVDVSDVNVVINLMLGKNG